MVNHGRVQSDSLVKRFINWKSIMLFWLAFALLPCVLNLITSQFSEWALSLQYVMKTEFLGAAVWALITPFVFLLARKIPVFGKRWLINMLIHCAAGFIVPLAFAAIFLLFYRPLISLEEVEYFDHYVIFLEYHLYGHVLIYWFLVLTYHVLAYADRYRHGELVASRTRELLVDSRLKTLRAQLQPHFLFNTLHTIGSLVRLEQKKPALEAISDLGELLRHSLYSDSQSSATLSKELSFVRRYLKIESQRFQDRLTVEYNIDPQIEDAIVPSFLLQPLVENAIKHGICGAHDAGRLEIIANLEGDQLIIEVRDDGPGLSESCSLEESTGVGLRNIRKRLEQLYGKGSTLVLENRSVRGAAATVRIPFKTIADGGAGR
jgi:two-component system LytT family sensor kinase